MPYKLSLISRFKSMSWFCDYNLKVTCTLQLLNNRVKYIFKYKYEYLLNILNLILLTSYFKLKIGVNKFLFYVK